MTFKELRTELNLTQAQVADILGVSQKTISAIETGERQPGRKLTRRIKYQFGLTVEEIWTMFGEGE